MKLLTFTVPCYNSEAYMEHCVETLLTGGDEVEIILVDDGSTDRTGEIADRYAEKYPEIIRVIHQPNGGHGEGVNQGIRNAKGLYFKVVDSDDWLDPPSLARLLEAIRGQDAKDPIDLYICNYVYEHSREKTQQTMSYTNVFPTKTRFSWNDIRHFHVSQYLCMHTTIYRTAVLRESRVVLPKHTFYVDNIFVYTPLPYVKSLYYMDIDLYRYFIGRDDQSVNESVMIKRVDQQLRITRILKETYTYGDLQKLNRKLTRYMVSYMTMMMTISSVFLDLSKNEESYAKHRELWKELKRDDPALYRAIRSTFLGFFSAFGGPVGRTITLVGYRLARKLYPFN